MPLAILGSETDSMIVWGGISLSIVTYLYKHNLTIHYSKTDNFCKPIMTE